MKTTVVTTKTNGPYKNDMKYLCLKLYLDDNTVSPHVAQHTKDPNIDHNSSKKIIG